jgi:hypothetical protein
MADDFEQRSVHERVRLARSSREPDSRGYFVYLDGELIARAPSLDAGRAKFRELTARYDPPRPIAGDGTAATQALIEQEVARFYAERSMRGQTKGGRSRRK